MKLEQAMVIVVFCSCLVEINVGADGETQAMSSVELTSSIDKSGRLAVCHNETIVYRCRTTITHTLTWNIYISPQNLINKLFSVNDSNSQRFVADNVLGRYFMYLQNNGATDNYLLSYLVIPYNPEWNGTQVQCMSGLVSKNLNYVVTGSPTPPSSVWHTVTQDYVDLNWNTTTESDTDCSMVMITVGDKNLLNASHQAGRATLNITEYHSNDSIVIEMYGINKCGMKSNHSTKEIVEKNSTHVTVPAETCQDQLIYMGFGVGIGGLMIGLALGVIVATILCRFSGSCSGSGTKKPELMLHGLGEK